MMKKVFSILLAIFLLLTVSCAIRQDEFRTPEPDMQETYDDFDAFFDKITALTHAITMFYWDMDTGGMPPGAIETRARVISVLDAELFEMKTSETMLTFFQYVEAAIERGEATDIQMGLYREFIREYNRLMCIPADEYKAFSELAVLAVAKWEEAKDKSDFSIFAPYLQQLVDYQRKFIIYRADAGMVYDTPYDALLDDYEPGMTVEILDAFFAEIRENVVPLLQSVTSGEGVIRDDFLTREVSEEIQLNVAKMLMETLGFDLNRGILAQSAHPFATSMGRNDVRITTHINPNDFFDSFFGVAHETGHAIYEQNISERLGFTPLETGSSMGIHESQSRFFENVIGRSLPFWEGIYDVFIRVTEGIFDDVSALELYAAVNIAKPSLIRIQADELTYPLHIMVRYEIEKMLFNDPDVKAEDLPEIWNAKMQEYLGVTPANDAEGILQDIHWAFGEFGYFPSYVIGSAFAAQILDVMENDFDVWASVRALDFETINGWLAERVHKHGAMLSPGEIYAQVAYEGFNPKYYVEYLTRKFGGMQ